MARDMLPRHKETLLMTVRRNRFVWSLSCVLAALLIVPPELLAQAATPAQAAAASNNAPQDKWPRQIAGANGNTVNLYAPQLDSWDGRTIEWHAAVSIQAPGAKEPTFGVIFCTAKTDVDKTTRMVTLTDLQVAKVNFPSAAAANDTYLKMFQEAIARRKFVTVSLDRVEASLAILQQQKKGESQPLKNDPPKIIFSSVPAVLVLIDGEPVWRPQEKTGVERVINTSPILLKDAAGNMYLHVFDGWLESRSLPGPWTVAKNPPASLSAAFKQIIDAKAGDPLTGGVPDDPDAKNVDQPTLQKVVPVVHVATSPTELIVTDGQPNYVPIDGTQLLYVKNTTGRVFKSIADQKTYVNLSGRWFCAPGPEGPWTYVAFDALPKDFAAIPDESPMENVKASVPGTKQAQEAVVANSVPQTAAISVSQTKAQPVKVDGAPQMKPIEGTSLQYVVNASSPIIMVTPSAYYLCQNGIWFVGASATGPWTVATSVPAVIYSIPPSSPLYNVTYVKIYDTTPTVVYVGYTPGYQGAIIYNGVVVYGTGYYYTPWVGTVWYGPPVTYGFGVAIAYSPWTGWAYGFGYGCAWGWGHVTVAVGWGYGGWGWGCAWGGWYGGWHGGWYGAAYWGHGGAAVWGPGYARWTSGNVYHQWGTTSGVSRSGGGYNAWTGNSWYGKEGAAYNSTTGTLAAGQRGSVSNVYTGNYASGGRGVATNTKTGTTVAARGGTVGNAYTGNSISGGQAKVYNPNTGNTTKIGGVTTSNGGSAARVGDTAVGKTSSGDYYATHDGNVYKNTGNGWQEKTSNGWDNMLQGSSQQQQLNKESQARQTGEQRYNSFQSNGGASRSPSNWNTGGRSAGAGGGGGGRRR
jgi:hypothetical protein